MTSQPPLVVVIMGVAGSSKTSVGSTLASKLGWRFHDADDDHAPANLSKMAQGEPLTDLDLDRHPWLELLARRIRGWLNPDSPTVLACSALTKAARGTLRHGDPRVQFVFLHGSFPTIMARLKRRRGHAFGPELLANQFDTLEPPDEQPAL